MNGTDCKAMERLEKKKWVVLLSQICIILLLAFINFRNYQQETIEIEDSALMIEDSAMGESQGCYIEKGDNEKKIISQIFHLKKGIYYLNVHYLAGKNARVGIAYEHTRKNDENLFEMPLNMDNEEVSYRFVVTEGTNVYFYSRLTGDAGTGDFALINSIDISSSRLEILRFLTIVILLFVCVDISYLLFLFYKKLSAKKDILIFFGLIILSFLIGIPLYKPGMFDGIDITFHLMRIEGIYHGLVSGQFPVKIQPEWLNGYGYPVSVFYGDVLLYIPAVVRCLGFSLQESMKFFLILVNVATVICSYICFNKVLNNKIAAFTGTVLYCSSIRRLYVLYEMAQIGQVSAMLFYPIVFAGFYLLLTREKNDKDFSNAWIYLLIGFSGLLQTHLISCLMIGLFSIVIILLGIKCFARKEVLIQMVKLAISGIAINLWFLIPFFDYYINADLLITNSGVNKNTEMVSYLTKFVTETCNFGNLFSNQGVSYALAIVCVGCFLTNILRKKSCDEKPIIQGEAQITILAMLALGISCSFFPHIALAQIIPVLGTYFHTIQMAYRFLSVAVVFLACMGGMLVLQGYSIFNRRSVNIFAIILCCFSLYSAAQYLDTFATEGEYFEALDVGTCSVGNGEYLPSAMNIQNLNGDFIFDTTAIAIEDIASDGIKVEFSINNSSSMEQKITVPRIYYEGYRCRDILQNTYYETFAGENKCVAITIPAYYSGRVQVNFLKTWYWKMAEVVSILAMVMLITYLIFNRTKCKLLDKENCLR